MINFHMQLTMVSLIRDCVSYQREWDHVKDAMYAGISIKAWAGARTFISVDAVQTETISNH